jgi:pimeloyl-ACP methyl ester carboxylesterase
VAPTGKPTGDSGRTRGWRLLLLLLLAARPAAYGDPSVPVDTEQGPPRPFYELVHWTPQEQTETLRYFRMPSALLSRFWGRSVSLESVVILPPGHSVEEALPVCYYFHGFGNWQTNFDHFRPSLEAALADPDRAYPRMIYAFPNAQIPMGHTVFADSVNMGPWGQAFVEELAPAIEAEYGASSQPSDQFLTGFSSGGWSSLWLQVTYPERFGGAWSVSPDPVDFRHFTGVNLYTSRNLYLSPTGDDVMMMRKECAFSKSLREFIAHETSRYSYGFQYWSFDAVFSPKGPDGRPMALFERDSGAMNRQVLRSWRKYDIRRLLQREWDRLAPALSGKIHVYVGECDTFRLEEGVRALEETLQEKGADAQFVYVPEGSHWLYDDHRDLFPNGLMEHLHRDMMK